MDNHEFKSECSSSTGDIIDVNEAHEYFGGRISRWLIYEAVKKNILPHVRLGRRILLRRSALNSFMAQMEQESLKIKKLK